MERIKAKYYITISFCLADTVCLWVMAVTNLLDFYLGGGKYVLLFVSRLIAFTLLEYLAWRYLRKPYLELQDAVKKGWAVFAGMTALYYILLVAAVQFPTNIVNRPEDTFLCVLILVLMLFIYGTIFTALYRQLLLYRKQQGERILLEQKNTLEAQMDTLSGQFCANPYINAVFLHYAGKLEKMGAEFRNDIQIGEEELPYMELCQILSNGLENACDALAGLEKEKRRVSVHMRYNRNYLLIRIRNRCRDDLHVVQGKLPATDKEGLDHGFGLATIKEAAERLDGEIFCYTENGDFVLDVMVSCRTFPNSG